MRKRIAMISLHECPLASSEGKERGGINVYTFELSKALVRNGFTVDAFTRIQDTKNPKIVEVQDGLRVIHLPCGPALPISKSAILSSLNEFTRALFDYMNQNRESYDVVHAHYYLSGMVALLLRRDFGVRFRFVQSFHTLGLLKQLVARSVESADPAERIPAERDIAASADAIISSGQSERIYLTSFYDCPEEKIHVVSPGVDTNLFRPLSRTAARIRIGASADQHIVLAVGRIDPVKGFDVLLAAIKILSKTTPEIGARTQLWIVGGDITQPKSSWTRELAKLENLRTALGLSARVKFVPAQPQESLPAYYSAADVLVLPSHYESFGMVALEAIASGTPVIATDVTGISPIVEGLAQGHVVSANNPIALAREIGRVLTAPKNGMQTHKIQTFDWNSTAQKLEEVYSALAS